MLTESFFVRKVKQVTDPETGVTGPESDEEGEVGIVRTIQFVPIPDPSSPVGGRHATILGVCWEKSNFPAICWEDPADLEHLDDTLSSIIDRLQEDQPEEFLEKTMAKLFEKYGAEAVFNEARNLLGGDEDDEEEEGEEELAIPAS